MVPYVVSACLVGFALRYDGRSNFMPEIYDLYQKGKCLAVCPEYLAGFGVPRLPIEICGNRVLRRDGLDVTADLKRGVARAVLQVRAAEAKIAILKGKSPSCGINFIYDGSFTKTLVSGHGLFAKALLDLNFTVLLAENFAVSK